MTGVASWCLEQGIALGKARGLVRRAVERAASPVERLEAKVLEARLASAVGDHDDAVALMEEIDEAVPDNETVKAMLERFRELQAEAEAEAEPDS